uniref:Uncharacterized protein n=1 Tax=Ganoderma tsugae TaxID=2075311 RepID=A0A2S1WBB4_GANTS|nr:hypothetical protein [Ganoderma tsugae]AWJ63876.1 hypothetical protein [Ganoderma tsugae]
MVTKKHFHSSNVLYSNVPPLSNNPVQDAKYFNEIRAHSEPMTASEYIESTVTSYSEAFPELSQANNINKKEIINNSLNLFVQENESVDNKKLFSPLYPLIKGEKPFNSLRDVTNSNTYTNEIKSTIENILFENKIISKTENKVIEYLDGKVIIDLESVNQYTQKLYTLYQENPGLIGYGVPGLGALLMYRAVVKLHANTAFIDENTITDQALRISYLKMRARQAFVFNSTAATLIVMSLMGISYALKNKYSKTISTITNDLNKKEKSITLFTLLQKRKNNNRYLKYVLLLISILIMVYLPYNSIFTLSILNFKIITMLKVVGVLFINLLLLYNLFILYYINKYSRIDSINFSKYTPAFIKCHFIELHSMSKLKDVYIIKEMVLKNTILCLLLQTVVIILLLVIG